MGKPHTVAGMQVRACQYCKKTWTFDVPEVTATVHPTPSPPAEAREPVGQIDLPSTPQMERELSPSEPVDDAWAVTPSAQRAIDTFHETLARQDAEMYGTGYLVNGTRVAPQNVRVFTTRPSAAPEPIAHQAQGATVDAEYEVWQDDMCVAGASGPNAEAEAMHYAAQYAQDSDVIVQRIVRTEICRIARTATPRTDGERLSDAS